MQSSLKTKCHQSFLSTKVNSFIVLQHATNPYIHPGHHFPPFVLHTSYPDITFSVVKTPQDKPTYLPWTPFPPYMTNQTSDPGHHFICSEDPPGKTRISTLDTISTIRLTHPPGQIKHPTLDITFSVVKTPQDKPIYPPWTPFPPFLLHPPRTNQTSYPGHHFFCSEDPPRQTHISTLDTISTIHLTHPPGQIKHPTLDITFSVVKTPQDKPIYPPWTPFPPFVLHTPQDKSNILPWTSLFL